MTGEFEVLAALAPRLGSAPVGEVWGGDDCAVLGDLVVTVDPVVDGVHLDRSLMSLADAGWKVVARNVSDVAAMGATPWRAVVSVVGAGASEVASLYDGVVEAAARWDVGIVGGDLAGGPGLVVTVTLLGHLGGAPPVLRSGASDGDLVWVAVPGGGGLGRGAAGLRRARSGAADDPCQRWLRRPEPSVQAGALARACGATAMVDVSDGLLGDLGHLADASGVGYRLSDVPVADGATAAEALTGGDEYALVFTAPPSAEVEEGFAAARLDAPTCVGRCVADPSVRTVDGAPAPAAGGWRHEL